jgi:hypothetical protein
MAKSRAAQPGKVTPRVKKMFTGRGKTRDIPVITDTSDLRAIKAAAADQKPKGQYVNMPSGPRPKGQGALGKKIGATKVRGGVYNHGVEDNR